MEPLSPTLFYLFRGAEFVGVRVAVGIPAKHDVINPICFAFQNVLRELEGKKPQLDELVASADSLKDDASRTQLHQKGE